MREARIFGNTAQAVFVLALGLLIQPLTYAQGNPPQPDPALCQSKVLPLSGSLPSILNFELDQPFPLSTREITRSFPRLRAPALTEMAAKLLAKARAEEVAPPALAATDHEVYQSWYHSAQGKELEVVMAWTLRDSLIGFDLPMNVSDQAGELDGETEKAIIEATVSPHASQKRTQLEHILGLFNPAHKAVILFAPNMSEQGVRDLCASEGWTYERDLYLAHSPTELREIHSRLH